ncbi:MAG: pyruvate, water dikinase [Nitrospirae bacterium]|nr:MAG: pyruvate, water dikinase [Nitrospirota bacterium]
MNSFLQKLQDMSRKILGLHPHMSDADIQSLRTSFQDHYKSFRSLLTANNNALELMAGMEQTLRAGQPFSMAFVRGHCTALTVNIYKMIQHLQELSNGKYGGLTHAFDSISGRMEEILSRQPKVAEGKLILSMSEVDIHSTDRVGGKMANLGEIRNHIGLDVPDGFVITAAATKHFMDSNDLQDEINRRLKLLDHNNLEELYTTSAAIQQLIANAPLPEDLENLIKKHYEELAARNNARILVSMRSSALGEDSSNISFAGQYRTQLNVSDEFLGQTYKEIVASKYKSQAIVYRTQRGFRHQDVIMCVGCLVMVNGTVSGVMYSRSPRDPRSDWVVINAAPGLAGNVVDGSALTDLFRVSRNRPHDILTKELRIKASSTSPDIPESATLTDTQAQELALIAVRLEKHFGSPQDIEWSIEGSGRIVILQSRPLAQTALSPAGGTEHTDPEETQPSLLSGGVTASAGVACGPVHIVRSNIDLLQFPKDAVLVVEHPLPDWATLLARTVAVVSETGHVTAHLATVSREFGLPALFGIADATKKLCNGDIITVDAVSRRIYKGCRPDLLEAAPPPSNLMAGSPVYRLLEEVLKLVTPLNLINPASPYFRPSSCETYHDLTRFCHEKAVTEMFSFSSRYGFDEKSAKQLYGDVPFQWWVIDLEDGFREGLDVKDRWVRIEDIVSLPMLAIWEGMTAVPWKGPPPVDLKGFGSILFRSTMNPNLDPAVRSSLTAKSYFLISKNFCNLSVRLGYHFSLVETHLSDLLTENYVSFQFKGGAADDSRKFIRVQLLKDILEQYDFRVEQKADALTARIEKKPAPFLIERLKVLGYLLIHTRQIDMVMGEQIMVENYRRSILADLGNIINNAP